jgi:hypothetical protein
MRITCSAKDRSFRDTQKLLKHTAIISQKLITPRRVKSRIKKYLLKKNTHIFKLRAYLALIFLWWAEKRNSYLFFSTLKRVIGLPKNHDDTFLYRFLNDNILIEKHFLTSEEKEKLEPQPTGWSIRRKVKNKIAYRLKGEILKKYAQPAEEPIKIQQLEKSLRNTLSAFTRVVPSQIDLFPSLIEEFIFVGKRLCKILYEKSKKEIYIKIIGKLTSIEKQLTKLEKNKEALRRKFYRRLKRFTFTVEPT